MKKAPLWFLKGAITTAGGLTITALSLKLAPIRAIATRLLETQSALVALSIFLVALLAVLSGFLIHYRVSYLKMVREFDELKRRIIERRLTLGDHIDKQEWKRINDDLDNMLENAMRRHE